MKVKAEDIASFDVTPSWERSERIESNDRPLIFPSQIMGCMCGLCGMAAAGHL